MKRDAYEQGGKRLANRRKCNWGGFKPHHNHWEDPKPVRAAPQNLRFGKPPRSRRQESWL